MALAITVVQALPPAVVVQVVPLAVLVSIAQALPAPITVQGAVPAADVHPVPIATLQARGQEEQEMVAWELHILIIIVQAHPALIVLLPIAQVAVRAMAQAVQQMVNVAGVLV